MSKKIVVITGSPRKNGNSFAMTEAFIKAAEDKGHTVTRFDAAMKQVGGCHACETCFKTGKACSLTMILIRSRRQSWKQMQLCSAHRFTGIRSRPRSKGLSTKCIPSVWQGKRSQARNVP